MRDVLILFLIAFALAIVPASADNPEPLDLMPTMQLETTPTAPEGIVATFEFAALDLKLPTSNELESNEFGMDDEQHDADFAGASNDKALTGGRSRGTGIQPPAA